MAAVMHHETGRDMISTLPAELKLEIIAGLSAAEIARLQSVSKEWQDLIQANEYSLARRIGDRENSRLRRVIEKCDIRGLDPLAALMRYDELFNIYDMSTTAVVRERQYAFGHAYALAASKDLGPLEDVADAAYNAAGLFFDQQRYARIRGWSNTFFTQQTQAQHREWAAPFRGMGTTNPWWNTLRQLPRTIKTMCFWVSAARPFEAVPCTHDERRKTTLTPSKHDGAVQRPGFTRLGLPLMLWDTPFESTVALPQLPANWLFQYVVPEPDERLSAASRPLRDAHLQESVEIELYPDLDFVVEGFVH